MMKNKKYAVVLIIFIVLTLAIIKVPSIYFASFDNKILERTDKQKINFNNIYDNYNLNNLEKIKIIAHGNQTFSHPEYASKEKFTELTNIIYDELNKINSNIGALYKRDLTNYNRISDFFVEKVVSSSSDFENVVNLRVVNYIIYEHFQVYAVIDAYDNTIITFSITALYGKFLNFELDDDTLIADFSSYLGVDSKYVEVYIRNYGDYQDMNLELSVLYDLEKEGSIGDIVKN